MPRYHVIFRSHDATEHWSRYPRPFGLDKKQLIQVCFRSVLDGLEGSASRIQVLGDRLSDETVAFFKQFPVELRNEELGVKGSFQRAVELALGSDDDEWVYMCEDDYLHHPDCFRCIDDLIDHRHEYLAYRARPRWRGLLVGDLARRPLYVFPGDYPDRYQPKRMRGSFVFVSRHRHWRQITSTTFTFIGLAGELKRRRALLERCAARLDDRTLSRRLYGDLSFFGRGLCVSPVPGLSTHMHEGLMSPLVDWRAICDANLATLRGT